MESRAVWSTAYVNSLPDSSFLYIEPGGTKDSEGKTTPRSLRHFPYKDENGNVDLAHLRNALARIPQSNLPQNVKDSVMAKARRIASANGVGESAPARSMEADMVDLEVAIERRYSGKGGNWNVGGLVEIRQDEAGHNRIGGYAAVFNKPSDNLGGFVEVGHPEMFNKARGDGWPDVVCRFNHDDLHLLGTTGARTLDLSVDDFGLYYVADPPQSRSDILELVQRGDIRKSSFAFRAREEDWQLNDQKFPTRHLLSVQLFDVAPVVRPAYGDTTANVRAAGFRSFANWRGIEFEEVRSVFDRDGDLRAFFERKDKQGAAAKQQGPSFGPAAMAYLESKRDPFPDA